MPAVLHPLRTASPVKAATINGFVAIGAIPTVPWEIIMQGRLEPNMRLYLTTDIVRYATKIAYFAYNQPANVICVKTQLF